MDIGPPHPTVTRVPLNALTVLVGAIKNEISGHITPPKACASHIRALHRKSICHLVYQSREKLLQRMYGL
jgi:hypothetical protein